MGILSSLPSRGRTGHPSHHSVVSCYQYLPPLSLPLSEIPLSYFRISLCLLRLLLLRSGCAPRSKLPPRTLASSLFSCRSLWLGFKLCCFIIQVGFYRSVSFLYIVFFIDSPLLLLCYFARFFPAAIILFFFFAATYCLPLLPIYSFRFVTPFAYIITISPKEPCFTYPAFLHLRFLLTSSSSLLTFLLSVALSPLSLPALTFPLHRVSAAEEKVKTSKQATEVLRTSAREARSGFQEETKTEQRKKRKRGGKILQ